MEVRQSPANGGTVRASACLGRSFGILKRCGGVALAVAAIFIALSTPAARAETDETCTTQADVERYIQSKPVTGPYRLYVFGDSLGDGAWAGLTRRFKGDEQVKVFRKTKVNSGIVRADRYDWNRAIVQIAREPFQIAVMMFGANDLQSIRAPGKRHHFNTPGWHEIFNDRLDRILEPLKQRKVAIYWIGLPVVRRAGLYPRLQDRE